MSAAATDASAPPKKGLPKKLIIIIAAVVLLLVVGGGAAVLLLKKKPAHAEGEGEAEEEVAVEQVEHDRPKTPPVYVPLDAFTVNLADRNVERFAQIGITLELSDAKLGDELKNYMPAVRNALLMVLAHKTSTELLERRGKEKLAREIQRETMRAMGYEVDDEDEEEEEDASAHEDEEAHDEDAPKKKKKKKKKKPQSPIRHVHFSSFIIQ